MKFGFQTTLRDRVEIQRPRRSFSGSRPRRPSSRRCRFRHRLPAHRPAQRARAPDRGQMVERHPDRALHRARRFDRRGGGDGRAPDGGARRPRRRQRAGRDRRPGNADHGRLGGGVRRRDRLGRPRPSGAAAPRHPGSCGRCGSNAGRAYAELRPAGRGFRLDVEIDFDAPTIGRQRRAFDVDPVGVPPRHRARAHLRLRQRRQEAVAGRASRSARRSKIRSRSTATRSSIPRACATATSSSVTRRSTRSAILRWPARRSSAATAPTGPGTRSTR